MIGLSELPTIDEVWDACSDLVRAEQAIGRQFKSGSPKLVMSEDYSCELHLTERGLRRLSDKKLIALMLISTGIKVAQTPLKSWRLAKESLLHNKAIAKTIVGAKLRYDQRPKGVMNM